MTKYFARGSSHMPTCPACFGTKGTTKDSRPTSDGTIRRRRACENCGHRFTTIETVREEMTWNTDAVLAKLLNIQINNQTVAILVGELRKEIARLPKTEDPE